MIERNSFKFQQPNFGFLLTHQARRSYVVISFDDGIRTIHTSVLYVPMSIRRHLLFHTENKLMTNPAAGRCGSL